MKLIWAFQIVNFITNRLHNKYNTKGVGLDSPIKNDLKLFGPKIELNYLFVYGKNVTYDNMNGTSLNVNIYLIRMK